MSDEHDHGHRHDHSAESEELAALKWKYDRAVQLAEHMRHVIVALKDLVPKAFEEGFRLRVPDTEEPWLIDWLQSETKRRLDVVMPRPPRPPEP